MRLARNIASQRYEHAAVQQLYKTCLCTQNQAEQYNTNTNTNLFGREAAARPT